MGLGSGIRDPRSGIRGIRDPGSEGSEGSEIRDPEKNLFRIPDPGSRSQKGTGSRIPDPDPQHCLRAILCTFQISVDFYERGAGGHSLRSLPFQSTKKTQFFYGHPPPLKWPLLWICPPQNHFVPHHRTTGTLTV
jgi:hypothetical protein